LGTTLLPLTTPTFVSKAHSSFPQCWADPFPLRACDPGPPAPSLSPKPSLGVFPSQGHLSWTIAGFWKHCRSWRSPKDISKITTPRFLVRGFRFFSYFLAVFLSGPQSDRSHAGPGHFPESPRTTETPNRCILPLCHSRFYTGFRWAPLPPPPPSSTIVYWFFLMVCTPRGLYELCTKEICPELAKASCRSIPDWNKDVAGAGYPCLVGPGHFSPPLLVFERFGFHGCYYAGTYFHFYPCRICFLRMLSGEVHLHLTLFPPRQTLDWKPAESLPRPTGYDFACLPSLG